MRSIVIAMALLICSSIPAIAAEADVSPVVGVYLCQSDNTQFLTLRQDATFTLRQRKKPPDRNDPFVEFSGKFQVNGEMITLILDDGGKADGTLKANVFTDGQGDAWVKKGSEPKNVERPKYKSLWH